MRLSTLLKPISPSIKIGDDVDVRGLAYDSRKVKPGDVFFAVPGHTVDGHKFIDEALKKGAVAVVAQVESHISVPVVKVENVHSAMALLADLFFDHPSQSLPVIGVTGTNGKTTVTYLVESIMDSSNLNVGVMGTVNYRFGENERPAPNTTPMAIDVQSFLYDVKKRGADGVVMEVSSHALVSHRVEHVRFPVGVFTNLTQDHLDFHQTMDSYFSAKAKLFRDQKEIKAVVNIDDPYGQKLAQERDSLTFGFNPKAKLWAKLNRFDLTGNHFQITFPSGKMGEIHTGLMGKHNVENCLAAAGACLAFGISENYIMQGLNRSTNVPGRLERIEEGQDFVIVVDYAHTHDALEKALRTLREAGPKRLICVFGAGGDRDKTKRPKMGKVAAEFADFVFLTSDNPRSEDPKLILNDIEKGIKEINKSNYEVIVDRRLAINKAIQLCESGDILLIAGKGHETYQIIGSEKQHFSDQETALEALKKRV